MDNDKNPRARVRDLMGDGYSYTSNTLRSRARACEAGARVRGIFTVGRLRGRWTRRLTSLAALRADHENAAAAESAWRPIGVRASVRGLEQARPLSLTQPPPLRGLPRQLRHENGFAVNTKAHEIVVLSVGVALDPDLGIGCEVDQQPELGLGHTQIIEQLRPVLVRQFGYGLELENDLSVANHVRDIGFLNLSPFVENGQLALGFERNAAIGKLKLKALLIDFLAPSVAHVPIDVEDCSLNSIDLVLEKHCIVFHGGDYTKRHVFFVSLRDVPKGLSCSLTRHNPKGLRRDADDGSSRQAWNPAAVAGLKSRTARCRGNDFRGRASAPAAEGGAR